MQIPNSNPCIRCGKERIVSKTWTDHVGQALLTYSTTVCPDEECQKIVDEGLEAIRRKKELLMSKKEEAKSERARLVASTKELV